MPPLEREIYEKLTEIMVDIFDDDNFVASPTLVARDVFGWDSLAHLRLILAIERSFSIQFKADEISKLDGVAVLAAAIQAKTGGD